MPKYQIVLATINARYSHPAVGLRWIWATLGEYREKAVLREFTLSQTPLEIVEALLADEPVLVGLSVYIWNVVPLTQVVQMLKAVRPELVVVLGGPEVGYEYANTPIFAHADYLVRGEGELAFRELAGKILLGERPDEKVISAEAPELPALALPYEDYTDEDRARRITYIETSRGCPFHCAFCMSALDGQVREFPLEATFAAIERLIARGGRHFKFLDRTFNLREARVLATLAFFRERWLDGMQIHFEIVPDRLTDDTVRAMALFPPGALHLEVGIQSFSPVVLENIGRKQDLERTVERLRQLRTETGVLLHADLIAGLPGEDWDGFAAGFDRLAAIAPHEIQVGILKRLKGAPIAGYAGPHRLVFAEHPPYEVLTTDLIAFPAMQRIKRFARYLDLYYNARNFERSLQWLWRTHTSQFQAFMAFSDHVWQSTHRTHELPLVRQAELLYHYVLQCGIDAAETIAPAIRDDFRRMPGRKDHLEFLP